MDSEVVWTEQVVGFDFLCTECLEQRVGAVSALPAGGCCTLLLSTLRRIGEQKPSPIKSWREGRCCGWGRLITHPFPAAYSFCFGPRPPERPM